MGNVLIACEESQRVCSAFRKMGHDAYSCDIIEPSGGHPEWHIKGDALEIINPNALRKNGVVFYTMDGKRHAFFGKWDLIIAHPPCTYLSFAGNHMLSADRYGDRALERRRKIADAFDFFMQFIKADCDKIALENPLGWASKLYRKPDQIIHPYFFCSEGDKEYVQKRTCLWLKNLPVLQYTLSGEKPKSGFCEKIEHKSDRYRAYIRSKTFMCVADAMARQWGEMI